MQEPVAVLVDRGPVAVRPDSRGTGASTCRGSAPGRARTPRVIPGNGLRQTSSPTSPRTRVAVGVDDVHRHPERGPAERARLDRIARRRREEARADLGAAGEVDDRHARAADLLEEPAVRVGVPRLAGGAGTCAATRGRAAARRAGSARARASGRARARTRCSDSTSCQSRSCGQSGAPSAKTSVAPSAPPPTTVHGPMIQPMSVTKWMRSSGPDVGLVAGLARDRDEEAALHVDDALRLAGRAGGVGEQVRRLGVDLERPAARPGQSATSSSHGATTTCSTRRRLAARLLEDLEHRHLASRGASTVARVIDDLRLASLRAAARRRAPRSRRRSAPGPRRCARTRATRPATSGDIGRKIATRSPSRDAEPDERLGQPRHLARELGEASASRREPSSLCPTSASASGLRCGPAVDAVRGRSLTLPPDEPRRPLGPARDVDDRVPRPRELDARCPRSTAGQNHSGSSTEIGDELPVAVDAEPPHEPGRRSPARELGASAPR